MEHINPFLRKNLIFFPREMNNPFPTFSLIVLLFVSGHYTFVVAGDSNLQTYIVHVDKPPEHVKSHQDWHKSFLPAGAEPRLVYSYGRVFSGFAARLAELEVEAVKKMEGCVHLHPTRVFTPSTTHSPSFLGLHQGYGLWSGSNYGRGVIIGVLDTGISPTHPSFDDEGMPPPPSKWKGGCEFQPLSLCNNKIIGARTFDASQQGKGAKSSGKSQPFDNDGHGTHVASIAAGRFVTNANVLGMAGGTASGVAPDAHLAIYKVCHVPEGCDEADILAGIESAVRDGVDVISMSLNSALLFLEQHPVATASFEAMRRGILFSGSAGNSGPSAGSVSNEAPWMLTVGASTMDRRIRATVRLGNGAEFEGESAYQPSNFSSATLLPLVYPQLADDPFAIYCNNVTSLRRLGVEGKVVLCDDVDVDSISKGEVVKEAGGAAMILVNAYGADTYAEAHVLPMSHVGVVDGRTIKSYIEASPAAAAAATIVFKGTDTGDRTAPGVASFSSRGPTIMMPGLLKPDVVGPGVNILGAWPSPGRPFNMLSGTSMSCPHLSGVAALLKSAHPDWSPAMVKSAIMTTADTVNLNNSPIVDEFQVLPASRYVMGAGHVNPTRASSPGLVYDTQAGDYVSYLCSLNYTDAKVSSITHDNVKCSDYPNSKSGVSNLNYPSIEVRFDFDSPLYQEVQRTVTNVGKPNSYYSVKVAPPNGVKVVVKPEKLSFNEIGQKQSYTVSFAVNMKVVKKLFNRPSQGSLTWISSDGQIKVRSPISVKFTTQTQ